jgi:hypothetical protein
VTRRAKRLTVFAFALILAAGVMLTASDPSAPAGIPCEHLRVVVLDLCTHGPDPRTTSSTGAASGSVVCDGDGTSGKRVQVILARASDVPDRLPTSAEVNVWMGSVDAAFNDSAAQTGGQRHVRFVTNSDCTVHVLRLVLPSSADDSFSNTIDALQALNYSSPDRKYMIEMDSGVYCGIATISGDDRPWSNNASNTGTDYSRVDRPCWNGAESHELGHNLGAVQLSAPDSDGSWHCSTEADRLCYGGQQTYLCPPENERLLDCNHDSYFSTKPSGWLAEHWNVADSAFLIGANPRPSPTPRKCLIRLGKTVCI